MEMKRRGFTLLEVLLAVAIFAIVLLAMNTVFFSALRLERATNRTLDERWPLNQALAVLRRDLQGAVQPQTNSTLLPRHFIASGSGGGIGSVQSGSLEFYTTTGVIDDYEPWSDLQRVRYELVDPLERTNSSGREFVRRVTRNILASSAEDEIEQVLATQVESLEFLCFNGSDWRNTWDTEAAEVGLPQAVRVRIQLASQNSQNTTAMRLTQEPLELLVPLTTQWLTNSITEGEL